MPSNEPLSRAGCDTNPLYTEIHLKNIPHFTRWSPRYRHNVPSREVSCLSPHSIFNRYWIIIRFRSHDSDNNINSRTCQLCLHRFQLKVLQYRTQLVVISEWWRHLLSDASFCWLYSRVRACVSIRLSRLASIFVRTRSRVIRERSVRVSSPLIAANSFLNTPEGAFSQFKAFLDDLEVPIRTCISHARHVYYPYIIIIDWSLLLILSAP